jgi:hypothetical protein
LIASTTVEWLSLECPPPLLDAVALPFDCAVVAAARPRLGGEPPEEDARLELPLAPLDAVGLREADDRDDVVRFDAALVRLPAEPPFVEPRPLCDFADELDACEEEPPFALRDAGFDFEALLSEDELPCPPLPERRASVAIVCTSLCACARRADKLVGRDLLVTRWALRKNGTTLLASGFHLG